MSTILPSLCSSFDLWSYFFPLFFATIAGCALDWHLCPCTIRWTRGTLYNLASLENFRNIPVDSTWKWNNFIPILSINKRWIGGYCYCEFGSLMHRSCEWVCGANLGQIALLTDTRSVGGDSFVRKEVSEFIRLNCYITAIKVKYDMLTKPKTVSQFSQRRLIFWERNWEQPTRYDNNAADWSQFFPSKSALFKKTGK